MVVKGEHVSTKSYVKRNPYAKVGYIRVANPKDGWKGSKHKFANVVKEKSFEHFDDDRTLLDVSLDRLIDEKMKEYNSNRSPGGSSLSPKSLNST